MFDTKGIDIVFNELFDYFEYLRNREGDSVDLQLAEHYLKKCESHILRELHFKGGNGNGKNL